MDLGLIELNLEEFKLARKMYQDAVNALDECIDIVEKREHGENISEAEINAVLNKTFAALDALDTID